MLSVPDLLKAAEQRGLDAVCVTDHGRYDGFRLASELAQQSCVSVFMGIEITTTEGDVLVYSVEELSFPHSVEPQELIDFANKHGAVAVVAHPFRSTAPSIGNLLTSLSGLTGVEVCNGNCSDEQNALAHAHARRMNVACLGGSDAHCCGAVGSYYSIFDEPVRTQAEFVRAIRDGCLRPAGDGSPLEGR